MYGRIKQVVREQVVVICTHPVNLPHFFTCMKKSNLIKNTTRASKGTAEIKENGKYLRIQLPRHLYAGKQKYLTLGLLNTPENWAIAEAKLQEIQRDINYDEFDISLDKYRLAAKKSATNKDDEADENLTFQQMLEIFEIKYFRKRKKGRKSQDTFSQYQKILIRAFQFKQDFEFYLSKEDIDQAIYLTETGSSTRIRTVVAFKVFLDCFKFKFEYEFESGITAGYEPEKRVLPTDAEIIDAWHKVKVERKDCNKRYKGNAESWGWIFAVIATYGLRPHEVLAIDYEKSLLPPYFPIYINEKITGGTKTGSRVVLPLPLEWVTHFDIPNPKTKYIDESRKLFETKIRTFADRFGERLENKGINFRAYDMRHRYAIRGRELGFHSDELAKWLGHTLNEHIQTYQKYWTDDSHSIVYETGRRRSEELKIKKAQLRIAQLETELRLKKMLPPQR